MPTLDEQFYRSKSWGAVPISDARDMPTLKMRRLMRVLAARPRREAALLEVGCGSGRITSSIHARDPGLRLTAVDLSAEQIELARARHPGIEFVRGNGEALPFADDSFDFVVFFDFLEHIERPAQALAEMHRVLKPGGLLHLVCPAEAQSIYGISSWILRRHLKGPTAGHIQQFSRREIEGLVRGAGFRLEDEEFSYHLLGSAMDYALFALMHHPAIYRKFWTQNDYYATDARRRSGGFFNALLRLGNAIAWYESRLLGRVRLFATAVHLTACK